MTVIHQLQAGRQLPKSELLIPAKPTTYKRANGTGPISQSWSGYLKSNSSGKSPMNIWPGS
uniref:Uncharacterized protein n=1 Tax=Anguilla anguilla TaxID=7936 RepID=A0A0E9RJU0_ANGAN